MYVFWVGGWCGRSGFEEAVWAGREAFIGFGAVGTGASSSICGAGELHSVAFLQT